MVIICVQATVLSAHVDDGVSLDVADASLDAQFPAVPLGGADNAGGHRVLQGKRAADRNHKFPWPEVSRPAQRQHRELVLPGDGEEARQSLRHVDEKWAWG